MCKKLFLKIKILKNKKKHLFLAFRIDTVINKKVEVHL